MKILQLYRYNAILIFLVMLSRLFLGEANYINMSIKISSISEFDCVEVYFNHDLVNPKNICSKNNDDLFIFRDVPSEIKNLRIDVANSVGVIFKIDEIIFYEINPFEYAKKIYSISQKDIAEWSYTGIQKYNDDYYITNDTDPRFYSDKNFVFKQKTLVGELLGRIQVVLVLILFVYWGFNVIQLIKFSNLKINHLKILRKLNVIFTIFGFVLTIISSFPGHTNFDDIYTINEYWRGALSDLHPPAQALIWNASIQIGEFLHFPSIMKVSILLFLQSFVFWGSIFLISKLFSSPFISLMFILSLITSPMIILYSGHIGKDSAMAISFLACFCLLLYASKYSSLVILFISTIFMIYGFIVRSNAGAAALPIIILYSIVFTNILKIYSNKRKYLLITRSMLIFLILLSLIFINKLIYFNYVKINCCLGMQALMTPVFDLMGISVSINKNLIPDYIYSGSQYDLSTIKTYYSLTNLNWDGLKIISFKEGYEILYSWLSAVRKYPYEYLHHRLSHLYYFFGFNSGFIDYPYSFGFYNNLKKTGGSSYGSYILLSVNNINIYYLTVKDFLERFFYFFHDTLFFRIWPYLLIACISSILSSSSKSVFHSFSFWLFLSGIFYLLPYIILANSAHFRYLLWTAMSMQLYFFMKADSFLKNIDSTSKHDRFE